MSKRLLGVVLLAVLALAALAGPAAAVEEGGPVHHELPSIDEVGTQTETAKEFFPEAYKAPTVFPWFGWPLMIGATLLVLWVLLAYLVFQPRFASERKSKSRKGKR